MRMRVLTYLVFMLLTGNVFSQQEAANGLNFFNPMLYNPAITGSMDQNQIFLLNRNQWKEFNGPQVKLATVDFLFGDGKASSGLIFNDQKTGAFKTTKAKINYTQHVKLSESLELLLGLSGGVAMNRFNISDITATRIDDPVLSGSERGTKPDFDGGVALKGTQFNTGVTLTQLEGDMFAKAPVSIVPSRQIVIHGLYNISFNEDSKFRITPLVIAKMCPGIIYYDANLTASWNNMLWLGGGYRNGSTANVNIGIQFKNVRAGYSYELQINSLKGFVPPSHEIGLGYVFKSSSQSKQKKPTPVKTDRKESKTTKSSKGQNADLLAAKKAELQRLQNELSDREDNLVDHERKIYDQIDSLYSKASQQKTKTNEEELERVAKMQREVNKIKEELRQFTREKNVELFKLKQKIEALRREIDAIENRSR